MRFPSRRTRTANRTEQPQPAFCLCDIIYRGIMQSILISTLKLRFGWRRRGIWMNYCKDLCQMVLFFGVLLPETTIQLWFASKVRSQRRLDGWQYECDEGRWNRVCTVVASKHSLHNYVRTWLQHNIHSPSAWTRRKSLMCEANPWKQVKNSVAQHDNRQNDASTVESIE